jgi:hypothetical protein
MADNKTVNGVKVATREVSYSGETADIQAIALATLSGSDDAKTATDVSTTNGLPSQVVKVGTAVDAGNSSTAALAGGGSFTGAWTDVLGYAAVSVLVKIATRTHSIYLEWSSDGSNIDHTRRVGYTLASQILQSYCHSGIKARYYRVKITNDDGSAETTMRAQALLHTHPGVVEVQGRGPITGTDMEGHSALSVGGYDVATGGYRIAKVDTNGSWRQTLIDAAGAVLIGQKAAASSLPVVLASDAALATAAAASSAPIGSVSLGNNTGKTNIGKPGSLASSATTANQVVTGATWTVAAAKVGYILQADITVRLTTFAATATLFGTASLRINGTAVATISLAGSGSSIQFLVQIPEPIPVPTGQVIEWVVTPAAATAMTWNANILGYEK